MPASSRTRKPARRKTAAAEPARRRLTIENVPIERLVPAAYNPRTMSDEARAKLKRGIERFGLVDPIIVRRSDNLVVGGHQRLQAVSELGWPDVPVVYLDDLDDTEAAALNVLLNNPDAQGAWDMAKLADLLSEMDGHGFDATLTGFDTAGLEDILSWTPDALPDDDKALAENYSRKIQPPVYEPKADKAPREADLYDRTRADTLLAAIERAEKKHALPRQVATFLRAAAERHTVFRFDRIAEYYAHAPAEVQALMEDSALVIIDFDRAVELGYVKLTEAMLAEAGYAKAAEEGDDGA